MKKINTFSTTGNLSDSKDKLKSKIKKMAYKIGDLQEKMNADSNFSLLVILQGMDASGKDGVVNNVFRKTNPSGIQVKSFKKPTDEEFSHDFLWRVHKEAPAAGTIKVFNRSHYEDILVPSVQKYYTKEIIESRYHQINNFEAHLLANNTKIVKCYLHVSKEMQHERLRERIENPEKHWKHNDGDWESRAQWDDYMAVYDTVFEKCNKVPWHIIPADSNTVKSYYLAKAVLEALESMQLSWPKLKTEKF